VQFKSVTLNAYLDLKGWTDFSPRGAATDEEEGGPLLNNTLRTNQLSVNMELSRMAITGLDKQVTRGQVQQDESADVLGGQIHDTKLRLGLNPGNFTSSGDLAWDGIATIHGTLEGLEANLKVNMMLAMRSEMKSAFQEIKEAALANTRAEFKKLVLPLKTEAVIMRQELKLLKQDNLSLRASQSGAVHACQGLDPDFSQDWTHVLEFFMKYIF
jgi:hypothetical protein